MFSRFKKSRRTGPAPATATAGRRRPVAPPSTCPSVRRGPGQHAPASAACSGARRPRLSRRQGEEAQGPAWSEIKVELHKRLLESLNLAALEHATEADLRAEIAAIISEALAEMSVALNKEDRIARCIRNFMTR
jgi:pilus assembly protein CpaF